jgi:glycosyltransferase involved in cell wall biosynthesis
MVVVHPSDEMYGADKVLLESLTEIPSNWDVEVWLPTDVDYPRKELSTALASMGHTVRYLSLPVIRRSYLRPGALPGLAIRFFRIAIELLRARPDTVYVSTSALAPMLPLARLVKASTVLHLHEYFDRRTALFVTPFLYFTQRIVCVSEAIREPLRAGLRRRTRVIYNGFDLPSPAPEPLPIGGPVVCLVASRWNAWKGHDILLDAWDAVRRTDLSLVVLGAPPANGEAFDVAGRVRDLNNPGSVTIAGQTSDVRSYIDAAHLVLVPSVKPDPLPTIAIEAMAAGRAVMASDSGGLPEIVGNDGGYLVETGNVAAWVRALEGISSEDVSARSDKARARFEEKFAVRRYRNEIAEVLWR